MEPPTDYKALTQEQIKSALTGNLQQLLPGQEKGIRNACALPYELSVDGQLSEDEKSFTIKFLAGNQVFGKAAAGAPFNVYAAGKYRKYEKWEEVCNWSFAVRAGDEVLYDWPIANFENEQYHLKVFGPNGFFCEFKGTKVKEPVGIRLKTEQDVDSGRLTGNVRVILENNSDENQTVEIIDNAYGSGKQIVVLDKKTMATKVPVNLQKSFGWYDLTILIREQKDFLKRFAGRVETGKPSMTDPLMGRTA